MMGTTYEQDVVAWANEQAALLRAGNLSALDIEHIAEEIEDVGKSEQRELASRMAVLLAHLLKWEFQSERRSPSWSATIKVQRKDIAIRLRKTPSLNYVLNDPDWNDLAWADARMAATKETGIGLNIFPESCHWTMQQVLSNDFWPE